MLALGTAAGFRVKTEGRDLLSLSAIVLLPGQHFWGHGITHALTPEEYQL